MNIYDSREQCFAECASRNGHLTSTNQKYRAGDVHTCKHGIDWVCVDRVARTWFFERANWLMRLRINRERVKADKTKPKA